jgi:hypothetical protein
MAWKLKVNDEGNAVLNEGVPVFLDEDGKEQALDPNKMHDKILDLNKESRSRRERVRDLEKKLEQFADIDDPESWLSNARKAMDTVKNLEDKDLVEAQKVEQLKAELTKASMAKESKLKKQLADATATWDNKVKRKEDQIRHLMVSNRFATSKYFAGTDPKTTLPPEVAETFFGQNFKVEEQEGQLRLVAYDETGNPLLSRERMGEPAEFDEAIGLLIDGYPGKDRIMRAGNSGTGSGGGRSGGPEPAGDQDLKSLQKQYADARTRGDMAAMISLKGLMHEKAIEAHRTRR